jgi:hypothetical protein
MTRPFDYFVCLPYGVWCWIENRVVSDISPRPFAAVINSLCVGEGLGEMNVAVQTDFALAKYT